MPFRRLSGIGPWPRERGYPLPPIFLKRICIDLKNDPKHLKKTGNPPKNGKFSSLQ